jgi:mannose-6-phosphate isomerase-like protein (cupin superfamily)
MRPFQGTRRRMMTDPIGGQTRSFDKPDEHVAKGGAEIDVVLVGDMRVKRASYPPGWRFSTHMGAPRCQDTHVGYALSGRMTVERSDGVRMAFGPGDVFVIPPDHDAWVEGSEPCVIVQFDEGESALRRFNVAGPAAKAA